MSDVRIHRTKKIRSLSKTRSDGQTISPTKTLRKLREGHYVVVDDEESRHHLLTAAARIGVEVTSRRRKDGKYEVHRLAKPSPLIQDYCNLNTGK